MPPQESTGGPDILLTVEAIAKQAEEEIKRLSGEIQKFREQAEEGVVLDVKTDDAQADVSLLEQEIAAMNLQLDAAQLATGGFALSVIKGVDQALPKFNLFRGALVETTQNAEELSKRMEAAGLSGTQLGQDLTRILQGAKETLADYTDEWDVLGEASTEALTRIAADQERVDAFFESNTDAAEGFQVALSQIRSDNIDDVRAGVESLNDFLRLAANQGKELGNSLAQALDAAQVAVANYEVAVSKGLVTSARQGVLAKQAMSQLADEIQRAGREGERIGAAGQQLEQLHTRTNEATQGMAKMRQQAALLRAEMGAAFGSGISNLDALLIKMPKLGTAILGIVGSIATLKASYQSTRGVIEDLKGFGIDIDKWTSAAIEASAASARWAGEMVGVGEGAREAGQDTNFLANAQRTLNKLGIEYEDSAEGIRFAYKQVTEGLREQHIELAKATEAWRLFIGAQTNEEFKNSIEELAQIWDRNKDSLIENSVLYDEFKIKLQDAAAEALLLGENIDDELIDTMNRLQLETAEAASGMDRIGEAAEFLEEKLLGNKEAVDQNSEAVIRLIENWEDLGPISEEQADIIERQLQKMLDAYLRLGEEVPPDLQRVADKYGVVSSAAEEHAEKAEAAAEKAAAAEEAAAERRVAALAKISGAFARFADQVFIDDEEGVDRGVENQMAALESRLTELRNQVFLSGQDIQEMFDLKSTLSELESSMGGVTDAFDKDSKSQSKSSERVKKAIQDLVLSAGKEFSNLSKTQQAEIENLLGQFEIFAETGVESTQFVSTALERMGEIIAEAGGDTTDFEATLRQLEDGTLSLGEALELVNRDLEQLGEGGGGDGLEEQARKMEDFAASAEAAADQATAAISRIVGQTNALSSSLGQAVSLCEALKACMGS